MTLLPAANLSPPFQITRASHIVLTVKDLAASRRFYREVLGLILTAEDDGALYFRGVEEACHHSLVLRNAGHGAKPACARIGMRMFTEADLKRGKAFFEARGCPAAWVEVPFQGRTLHVTDTVGTPLEFCASMPVEPRMITKFTAHRGGCALRIDHYQVLAPEVRKACEFYMAMGFRLSEYIAPKGTTELRGVFLQRKGNPHDIVFFNGVGPRLHHFAFIAPEMHHLLHACDVAGELGYGFEVERGPGRHGPGHAMFVYFRDPDGHRVELFNTHYQVMDVENEPVAWDPADHSVSYPWGVPARQSWYEEATEFEGTTVRTPEVTPNPLTLEKFLAGSSATGRPLA